MVGVTLTEGPDVYYSTLRSGDPGIPVFQVNMLGGDDQLYVRSPCSMRAYLGAGNDYAQFTSMYDLLVYGEGGNDTIDLRSFWSLTLDGGDGADRVNFTTDGIGPITATGGAGNDSFYGNAHNFYGTINGGSGDDFFSGFGTHGDWKITLAGGTGNDTYRVESRGPADDHRKARRGDRYGPTDLPGGLRPAGQCRESRRRRRQPAAAFIDHHRQRIRQYAHRRLDRRDNLRPGRQ